MNSGDTINLYYFSGTGNTMLVAREMVYEFRKAKYNVNLFRIEKINPKDIKTDKILALAFPVAFQSTFPFIWRFLNSLPEVSGTRVFMVDTLATFSGGIVGRLKRVLLKKGYKPIGAKEIRMPSNMLHIVDEKKAEKKRHRGIERARKYAMDIINDKARWRRLLFLSDIVFALAHNNKVWGYMRRHYSFSVNKDRCNGCKICERLCPIGNIKVDKYPVWQGRDEFCMRCISFCPQNAIALNGKYKRYSAVSLKDMMQGIK